MKSKLLTLAIIFTLSPISLAYAGSGHDHGHGHDHGSPAISSEKAIIAASQSALSIVKQQIDVEGGKLDASWKDIAESEKSINRKGNGYYIISLNNQAQSKTLYVLISDQGEFYDANFSGTFKGLE
jgi:hypothetical protein